MKMNSDKLKIAMFGHKHIPSREGGVEIVVGELSTRMAALGHSVTCYNRSGRFAGEATGSSFKKGDYKGVKVRSVWTVDFKGLAAASSSFFAAIKCIFSRAKVVHIHAEGPAFMSFIPRLFGKRVIVTVHGLDWQREKWGKGFASKYIKFGEKVMVKCADEIIVLSESAKTYFKEAYNRDTVLIHNGIERPLRKDADEITKKYGLEKDGYICIVARLTAEKGVHYLIDAYNNIKTDKKLVIAGDTSDTDEYVQLLRQKAQGNENIIFTGFISGDILTEIYSNAYIVALPSDIEGMSLSLLEALAYKNAVICSDIPENTLVTEDRAMLFKKSDVKDLTEKLQELCDNAEAVNRLREGVDEFIIGKYNWNDVADSTYELYKKVLAK